MSSILGGRLAGKEGAFFFQESKHAVTRLAAKLPPSSSQTQTQTPPHHNPPVDVLPEILRHSLPPKVFRQEPLSEHSSDFSSPKWALRNSTPQLSGISPDVLNPLRGFLSLPQVTFGPRRWQLPTTESSVTASTANELRHEQHPQISSEKVRAAAEGLAHIGKAFAIATAIIFGSAALTFGLAAKKLDVHDIDDVHVRVKDSVQPRLETIKGQLSPLRDWAERTSKKWHLNNEQGLKERPLIKELSKILGPKSSS